MSNKDADILYQYLRDVLYDTEHAKLDIDSLSEDFKQLGEGLAYFGLSIQQIKDLSSSLAKGKLDIVLPPPENELAAPLKSLHASLKHLAWQTGQIAKGDYHQKVSFMGDFATSFNMMTKQLSTRWDMLLEELDQTTKKAEKDKEYAQMLESHAYSDALTGLHSRYYGMRTLKEWVDEKRAFRLCFIDLDNLKYVNDTFGHLEGDDYIIDTARLLKKAFPNALLVRLGGDEFMVLVETLAEPEIRDKLNALRTEMQLHIEEDQSAYFRSISYGIVEVAKNNNLSISTLLSQADEKMYAFKRAHKAQREDILRKLNEEMEL